jgi:hypothetical protein
MSLAYALKGKIGNIGKDELLDASKSLFDSNLLNAHNAKEVLLPLMQSSPFEIYDKFIKDVAGKGNTKADQALARETISFMIGKNPVMSIDKLIADANNDASRNIVTGFELWTNQDAKGAYNWFIDNESSLNPAQRSAAAMGFFVRAIESGEFEGAVQWNAYITDPRFKKTTDQVLKAKLKK